MILLAHGYSDKMASVMSKLILAQIPKRTWMSNCFVHEFQYKFISVEVAVLLTRKIQLG